MFDGCKNAEIKTKHVFLNETEGDFFFKFSVVNAILKMTRSLKCQRTSFGKKALNFEWLPIKPSRNTENNQQGWNLSQFNHMYLKIQIFRSKLTSYTGVNYINNAGDEEDERKKY